MYPVRTIQSSFSSYYVGPLGSGDRPGVLILGSSLRVPVQWYLGTGLGYSRIVSLKGLEAQPLRLSRDLLPTVSVFDSPKVQRKTLVLLPLDSRTDKCRFRGPCSFWCRKNHSSLFEVRPIFPKTQRFTS